jgi:hypothetical protein
MCIAITFGGHVMSDESGALLADLRALRHRTRADRHGYAFPLLLFGALVLAAPLLYAPGDGSWTPPGTLARFFGTQSGLDKASPNLIAWYWLAVIAVGVGGTVWWYRRRAERIGVATDTRGVVVGALAALGGFVVGANLLLAMATPALYSEPATNLPIMAGSAVGAGLAGYRSTRAGRTDGQRGFWLFLTALFAASAFAAIGVYLHTGMTALVVIAVVLVALAWLERSVLLGVVAGLFTLAAVPANHQLWYWDFPDLFHDLGWTVAVTDVRAYTLQTVLVPAVVLLAGGVVAAVRRVPAGGRDD